MINDRTSIFNMIVDSHFANRREFYSKLNSEKINKKTKENSTKKAVFT